MFIPIFIGGCERSGTTMLGDFLGSSFECIVTPESQFKIHFLKEVHQKISDDYPQIYKTLKSDWRFKSWELELDEINVTYEAGDCLNILNTIVKKYAQENNREGAKYWIDHTPENIKYSNSLIKAYPNAKIIHIIRDGRGVAASILPLEWGPNTIKRAALWWAERLSWGLAAEIKWPSKVMRVRYEDILQQPEKILSEICTFTGIVFKESMLQGGGANLPNYTKQQHTLVGTPPNPKKVDAWKDHLTNTQVEYFEYLTGDLLELLGYKTTYGLTSQTPPPITRVAMTTKESFLKQVNKIRYLTRRRLHKKK